MSAPISTKKEEGESNPEEDNDEKSNKKEK